MQPFLDSQFPHNVHTVEDLSIIPLANRSTLMMITLEETEKIAKMGPVERGHWVVKTKKEGFYDERMMRAEVAFAGVEYDPLGNIEVQDAPATAQPSLTDAEEGGDPVEEATE